jgi:tetratricopeptide (TPR) repeat protein
VHPFNVESVAWVSERKNVLSTLFFLLTLAAYGWYAQRPNTRRYFVVLATFICGLASKPMLVTLPAVLLLLDYWPLQRIEKWTPPSAILSVPQKNLSHLIWEKIPLLFFSIASSVITLIAQKTGEALEPFSLAVKIKTALAAYALYILKTFWPSSFALYYPDPFDPNLNQHPSVGDYLLVAAGAGLLVVITLAAWRYRRERPYLLVGWLWYVGTLVPVIGLVKAGPQIIADRYAYIPLIGIFVAVIWGFSEFALAHKVHRGWRLSASITLLIALFIISFLQVRYWRGSFDIFFHTLSVTKNNLIANEKVAVLLLQEGKTDDALHYYFEAARIAPWDPASHEAVAASLDEQGHYQEALQAYDVVIRNSKDPEALALAYSNLGVIHSRLGDFNQARADARNAARIDATRVDAQISGLARFYSQNPSLNGYIKLSLLLDNAGRLTEARAACNKAAEIDPASVEVRKVLEHLDSE